VKGSSTFQCSIQESGTSKSLRITKPMIRSEAIQCSHKLRKIDKFSFIQGGVYSRRLGKALKCRGPSLLSRSKNGAGISNMCLVFSQTSTALLRVNKSCFVLSHFPIDLISVRRKKSVEICRVLGQLLFQKRMEILDHYYNGEEQGSHYRIKLL
jgi:hypothetical protein